MKSSLNVERLSVLVVLAIAVALTLMLVITLLIRFFEPITIYIEPQLPSQKGPMMEPPYSAIAISNTINIIFNISQHLAPFAWITFLIMLMWKGKIRSIWLERGYDYYIFKALVKMCGSDTRRKIRHSLTIPKNKHQSANELRMDWRTI
ncbi:MAG: hypothetical protein QW560_05125 [Candidatus Nitrosocaldus sp.]